MAKVKKMGFRQKIILWFLTVLLFLVLLFGTAFLIFRLTVSGHARESTITYSYGENGSRLSEYEVFSSEYMPDGVFFVDFSRLAEDCGFTTTADDGEIKYIVDNESYDSVKFYYGSRFAIVNEIAVFLSTEVKFSENGHLLVPGDFISGFMNGVQAVSSRNEISVTYDPDEIELVPNKSPSVPIETE